MFWNCTNGIAIDSNIVEATGADIKIFPQKRKRDIRFYGDDIIKGNWFFRQFILKPDIKAGIKMYEKDR